MPRPTCLVKRLYCFFAGPCTVYTVDTAIASQLPGRTLRDLARRRERPDKKKWCESLSYSARPEAEEHSDDVDVEFIWGPGWEARTQQSALALLLGETFGVA